MLPLDYGRNLALVVAVVVAASVVFTVAMSFRRHGTENGNAAGQPPVAGRVSGR